MITCHISTDETEELQFKHKHSCDQMTTSTHRLVNLKSLYQNYDLI